MASAVDSSFWTTRRVFGVAGGPVEHVLTDAGFNRAFSVGAGVRPGQAVEALVLLASLGGSGKLAERNGSRFTITALGKFDQTVWSYLRGLSLVESISPDGVRLTAKGDRSIERGYAERESLLARVKRAHPLPSRE